MTQADRAVLIAREMIAGGAEIVEVRVGRVQIKICRPPQPPAPAMAEPDREDPEPADPRERAQAQRRREMGWPT